MHLRVLPIDHLIRIICLLDGRQVGGYGTARFLKLLMKLHFLIKIDGLRGGVISKNDELMLLGGAAAYGRLSVQHNFVAIILFVTLFYDRGLVLSFDNFTLFLLLLL